MDHRDYLIRATAYEGKARVFAVKCTNIVEVARSRHDTYPVATAALGRTISAGLMMGVMLKDEQALTVQIKGDGPLGQIVVDANAKGEVRGYVDNPHVELPLNARGKLDVAGAVGTTGFLNVIKDLGLKEPYRGNIPIVSGEIAEDFTYYFAKSEQTPSAVILGVLVDIDYSVLSAGGLMIQLLPGLQEEEIAELETKIQELPAFSSLLAENITLEEIVGRIFQEVSILETVDVTWKCKCSMARVEQTLMSLGVEEIDRLVEEKESTEVVCHFCNEAYVLQANQLAELSAQLKK